VKMLPVQFESQEIRRVYDEKAETWLFSVVDIIQVLTQQPDFQTARKYWNKLKERLGKEGSQVVTSCHRLKIPAADGKLRETDVASPETLLRLVQSVPSPKAEPIKLWLAKVGYERMQEMSDPSRALDRARSTWQKHGRSDKWIQQRMTGQETRNKLTDYWATHEIKKGDEYAVLTNITTHETRSASWFNFSLESNAGLYLSVEWLCRGTTPVFAAHYRSQILAGYTAVGTPPPDFAAISRKQALEDIAQFERLSSKSQSTAATALKNILVGLRVLDERTIPIGWV